MVSKRFWCQHVVITAYGLAFCGRTASSGRLDWWARRRLLKRRVAEGKVAGFGVSAYGVTPSCPCGHGPMTAPKAKLPRNWGNVRVRVAAYVAVRRIKMGVAKPADLRFENLAGS